MRGGKCCFGEKGKRERSKYRRQHIIKIFRGCAYELVYISDVSVFLTYDQQDYQWKEVLYLRLRALNIQVGLCAQLQNPLAFLPQIKAPSYALSRIVWWDPVLVGAALKQIKCIFPARNRITILRSSHKQLRHCTD